MSKKIIYKFRGAGERWVGMNIVWKTVYSPDSEDGNPLYPWMTYRECQEDAARQGAKAQFVKQGEVDAEDRTAQVDAASLSVIDSSDYRGNVLP